MERTLKNARDVAVQIDNVILKADLAMPERADSLVVFAHGSGSSRMSPRNRAVAHVLNEANQATLLMDLLTEEEERIDERSGRLRFDIMLLADRVAGTINWVKQQHDLRDLPMGLFGSSTGAAAALVAAAKQKQDVQAVVSRGGRPDLVGHFLPEVEAPTLLIVGGDDHAVIEMNRQAADQLTCEHNLEIISGATHLFSEPGKLERVAELARDWFKEKLSAAKVK